MRDYAFSAGDIERLRGHWLADIAQEKTPSNPGEVQAPDANGKPVLE